MVTARRGIVLAQETARERRAEEREEWVEVGKIWVEGERWVEGGERWEEGREWWVEEGERGLTRMFVVVALVTVNAFVIV